MPPRRQPNVPADNPGRTVLPGIDHDLTVHIQTRTVIDQHREPITTRLKTDRSGPTDRELVRWQTRGRRALSPQESNARIVANECRLSLKVQVGEIFTPPLQASLNAFPPDLHMRIPCRLIIGDSHRVLPFRDSPVSHIGHLLGRMPGVNEQFVVQSHLDPIVGHRKETVGSSLKHHRARPADRESIVQQAWRRGTSSPIESDLNIVTLKRRAASEGQIVEILAVPRVRYRGRRRYRSERRCWGHQRRTRRWHGGGRGRHECVASHGNGLTALPHRLNPHFRIRRPWPHNRHAECVREVPRTVCGDGPHAHSHATVVNRGLEV